MKELLTSRVSYKEFVYKILNNIVHSINDQNCFVYAFLVYVYPHLLLKMLTGDFFYRKHIDLFLT